MSRLGHSGLRQGVTPCQESFAFSRMLTTNFLLRSQTFFVLPGLRHARDESSTGCPVPYAMCQRSTALSYAAGLASSAHLDMSGSFVFERHGRVRQRNRAKPRHRCNVYRGLSVPGAADQNASMTLQLPQFSGSHAATQVLAAAADNVDQTAGLHCRTRVGVGARFTNTRQLKETAPLARRSRQMFHMVASASAGNEHSSRFGYVYVCVCAYIYICTHTYMYTCRLADIHRLT